MITNSLNPEYNRSSICTVPIPFWIAAYINGAMTVGENTADIAG
jgi:hypothetical protein